MEEPKKYPFKYEIVDAKKIYMPWKLRRKELGYTWDNFSLIPIKLPLLLRDFCPDIIISTEFGIRTLLAMAYAKIYRKKILIWSDEYLIGILKHSFLRIQLRKFLAKMADGFCSCGTENKKFLEYLGIPSNKITEVSIAVDNEHFANNATNEAR